MKISGRFMGQWDGGLVATKFYKKISKKFYKEPERDHPFDGINSNNRKVGEKGRTQFLFWLYHYQE